MTDIRKVRRQVNQRLAGFQRTPYSWKGFTGDGQGNYSVPNKPGFIYVRNWGGQPFEVLNNGVPTDQTYSVRVGWSTLNPSLPMIVGFVNPYTQGKYQDVTPHHETHEAFGSDRVNVSGIQFLPGLVIHDTGMTVAVYPNPHVNADGTYGLRGYETIDLTSYIPASGYAFALISIDDSGVSHVKVGSSYASLLLLSQSAIPAPDDNSYTNLAAVILFAGQSTITQNNSVNHIIDLRFAGGYKVIDKILTSLALTATMTPAALSADTNDYAPTEAGKTYADISVLRLSASAAVNLTGLTGGTPGRAMYIVNIGAYAITLKDESGSSTAANRFALSEDVVIPPDTMVFLYYSDDASRWRLLSGGDVMYKHDYDANGNGVVDDSESTQALQGVAIDPSLSPSNGQGLIFNGTSNQFEAGDLSSGGGGAGGHLHGLARWSAGSGDYTFELPDIAEYLESAENDGVGIDPLVYSLSGDRTQLILDTALSASHVITAEYVIASI